MTPRRTGGAGRGARSDGRLRLLAGYALFFVVLWMLWTTPVAAALRIFVVLLHEVSHGIAAVATGGRIERIVVTPLEGGLCVCPGGDAFVTLSAGYLGSLLWGAGFLLVSRRPSWARATTGAVGVLLAGVSLLYVRTIFGLAFGLIAAVGLWLCARRLSGIANARVLAALGLTSCLYALLDIRSDVLDRPQLPSDARMLAELTGVPAVIWGVLWIVVGLGVVWLLGRRILRAT